MTEDIYAKPDLSKKVRFQAGEKENRNTDACDDVDNARIYDNYCAEESTPEGRPQDKATEDQLQTASVKVNSGQRNLVGAAAVLLGLLLLVAFIILVVLFTVERHQQLVDSANLRDKLRTSYYEMKIVKHNLTQKMSKLENDKDHLKTWNKNLTKERDELQQLLNETTCCPDMWIKVNNSCYFTSTSMENWNDSKSACETYGAHLVIISSKEEQEFISYIQRGTWIGLTDLNSEGNWTWVDGTALTSWYWKVNQPDNHNNNEHCAEIRSNNPKNNWNDSPCYSKLYFICEKILK